MRKRIMAFWIIVAAMGSCAVCAAPAASSPTAQQSVDANDRAQRAERALEDQKLIIDARNQIETIGFTQFETVLSASLAVFGALITFLVVGFGFVTWRSAVTAAADAAAEAATKAAQATLAEVSDKIIGLHDQAMAATQTIEALSSKIQTLRDEAEAHTAKIAVYEHDAEDAAKRARKTAQRVDELSAQSSDAQPRVKAGDKKDIDLVVAEIETKNPKKWSIDEFKSVIGKASLIDRDYPKIVELAKRMETQFSGDTAAVNYARERQAFGLRRMGNLAAAAELYLDLAPQLGVDDPLLPQVAKGLDVLLSKPDILTNATVTDRAIEQLNQATDDKLAEIGKKLTRRLANLKKAARP